MSTLMPLDEISPSELLLNTHAQNLKHLLDAAQQTLYADSAIRIPPFSSIYYAVCACFGFRSIKGMTEHLKLGAPTRNIHELKPLDLMPALRNTNPKSTDTAMMMQVNVVAEQLLTELLMHPYPEQLGQLLSRLKFSRLSPATAEALRQHSMRSLYDQHPLFVQVIKAAVDSSLIGHFPLCAVSPVVHLSPSYLVKISARTTELNQQIALQLQHWIKDLGQEGALLSTKIDRGFFKAGYTGHSLHFRDSLSHSLRQLMIVSLKMDAKTQTSARILQNLSLQLKGASSLSATVASSSLSHKHNPQHPDFALAVLLEMAWAMEQVVQLLEDLIQGNPVTVGSDRVGDLDLFEWDANGLLSSSQLMNLYAQTAALDHDHTGLPVFLKLSPNLLYWVVQAGATDLLATRPSAHANAAIQLIHDCFRHQRSSMPVENLLLDVTGPGFATYISELRQLIEKNLLG